MTDDQIVDLGNLTCELVDQRVTAEALYVTILGSIDEDEFHMDAGYFTGAAVEALCPEYTDGIGGGESRNPRDSFKDSIT
jgi:hypothetical protein